MTSVLRPPPYMAMKFGPKGGHIDEILLYVVYTSLCSSTLLPRSYRSKKALSDGAPPLADDDREHKDNGISFLYVLLII